MGWQIKLTSSRIIPTESPEKPTSINFKLLTPGIEETVRLVKTTVRELTVSVEMSTPFHLTSIT